MDENKEFQAPNQETEVENISETDTQTNLVTDENTQALQNRPDTQSEENCEDLSDEAVFQTEEFSQLLSEESDESDDSDYTAYSSFAPDYAQSEKAAENGKKRLIQTPVIISFVCVLAAVAGFLIFASFFNSSIVGSWALDYSSTGYYVFDKDGILTQPYGTTQTMGKYTLGEDENGTTVTISNVTYNYKVTGNIFTGRKLELSLPEYDEVFPIKEQKFTAPKMESSGNGVISISFKEQKFTAPKMEPDSSFKPDEKLSGKWEYKGGGYNYDYTLKFNNDGTASYIQEYNEVRLLIDGVYTYDDETVILKYNIGEEAEMEIPYKLDGDKLIVMEELEFTRTTD